MSIPNLLTLLRIILVPIFVIVFYIPSPYSRLIAAIIFALAGLTDWLDGFLARTLGQISSLGEFLDPVADKLLIVVAICLLLADPYLPFLAIPGAIVISREIIISGLREWMSEIGKRTSVAVNYIGKVKTLIQMVALFVLLAHHRDSSWLLTISGYTLFYSAALLTVWSMTMYLKAAWPDLMRARRI